MAATLRTVRKNSREAQAMWDTATRAISRTLGGYFLPVDVEVSGARSYYERMGRQAKITCHGDGRYVVHYHSNHWLELLVPPSDA